MGERKNRELFFWWDRKLINDKKWARISSAAKAIFPVIACHCNRAESEASNQRSCFPGQNRIAYLSGRSEKTVRAGIADLKKKKFTGFNPIKKKYGPNWPGFKYFLILPQRAETKMHFPFYHSLIRDGKWRQLKPAAQALYPVMRAYRDYYDIELYQKEFVSRNFDICSQKISHLAIFAGISERSARSALNNLIELSLIKPLKRVIGWKVYLKT